MRASSLNTDHSVIAICHGPRCGDYGGKSLAEQCRAKGINVDQLSCQSLCPQGPIVRVDGEVFHRASFEKVIDKVTCSTE